jgi:3-deoxy-D-manno-octulosonic-acid transferase
MIHAYRVLSNLLYPIFVIFVYFRKLIKKEDPVRFKEKILTSHFNVKREKGNKLIWFHAASIGEFKSIIPIINN